jgi:hypothetical protein
MLSIASSGGELATKLPDITVAPPLVKFNGNGGPFSLLRIMLQILRKVSRSDGIVMYRNRPFRLEPQTS